MISTPSWGRRRPARAMRRARTGSGSEGERATSKRNCTAVETLLTFCPPGPEARTKSSWISRSSSSISTLTRIMPVWLPFHQMHVIERASEESLADRLEAQRHVGDVEVVARLCRAGVGELLFAQQPAQQRFQQWVMRAAEHQGIDVLGQ